MLEFDFPIQQTVSTFYNGSLVINAMSKLEAIEILSKMTYEEVHEAVTLWEINLDVDSTEPIEVFDETMKRITTKKMEDD